MKKIVTLLFCMFFYTNAMAQESKFVGTWSGVLRSFYIDYKDKTIVVRITQENGDYQVRIKECNPKDSCDYSYRIGVYGIEINGNTLQWYWKTSRKISEEEEDFKTYGAVYEEGNALVG